VQISCDCDSRAVTALEVGNTAVGLDSLFAILVTVNMMTLAIDRLLARSSCYGGGGDGA